MGDKCLFPHRGDKGVLLIRAAAAQNAAPAGPPDDGKAGAPAAAPKPKAKKKAGNANVAQPQIAPESAE